MTTAKITPAPKWDLESIFPGGSKSEQFKQYREEIRLELAEAAKEIKGLPVELNDSSREAWVETTLKLQKLGEGVGLIESFNESLLAQNVEDSAADSIAVEGALFYSEWQKLQTELEALTLKQSDQQWQTLLADVRLAPIQFYLNEMRSVAKSKMPVELESLALELGVNGYHAWNSIYEKMAGELRADFEQDGKTERVSMGQLANKMADPDREIRQQAFEKMSQAWQSRADLAAMILNSLGGFRLSLYERRGWETPVHEALIKARTQEGTVDTMWRVIERESGKLKPYIEAKKKLLGIDKFRWYDAGAPCGSVDKVYDFDDAGRFIIDNVRSFSPDMADFMAMALQKRWIEAEDRPGKRAGAFCTRMGHFKQTRVFMTYGGSYADLLTLAHELGHAYHGWVMKDEPYFATRYPMNLAETASIFAETLVTDAALDATDDPQERLMLLDQKPQTTYGMFTDLYSRYLFDRAFYAERKNSAVGKDRLSELMVAAQKRAFGDLLDESGYHPLFWCSKLHFFISDLPFYNFPYTFGYLFSGGVYNLAKQQGPAFADKYQALLAASGNMTTEEAAIAHLGEDLTQEKFWEGAVSRSLADVDEFVALANKLS